VSRTRGDAFSVYREKTGAKHDLSSAPLECFVLPSPVTFSVESGNEKPSAPDFSASRNNNGFSGAFSPFAASPPLGEMTAKEEEKGGREARS